MTSGNGWATAGAGDVNGDGYDDVIIRTTKSSGTIGIVSLFYGGPNMDTNPDINFTGFESDDGFGASLAGIGDVNKDGYDDIAIGAFRNDSNGNGTGCVYIYFGGPSMDNNPDVILTGEANGHEFSLGSYGLSAAGDVNDDGYDDVIVGSQFNDAVADASGRAYIYYGGKSMDNTSDIIISGTAPASYLGVAVSGAGDVNGDGIDDVIVGANGVKTAMIYFGSVNMDNVADIILKGKGGFGWTASGAGDVNKDGFDDVIVAENNNIYIFYGGKDMDTYADDMLYLVAQISGDNRLSSAGDINKDGYDDVIVGQYSNNTNGAFCGAWFIFTHQTGILDPNVTINQNPVWAQMGYFNDSELVNNFASSLNDIVNKASPSGTDEYGNTFVEIPIAVGAKCEGNITLSKLNITYTYKTPIPDFTDKLNAYISAHKSEKDANGNLTVPIKIISRSPGRVKLLNLDLGLDEGPKLVQKIPDIELREDSKKADLLDLSLYFRDDLDPVNSLKFDVRTIINGTYVNVTIGQNKYLSADALDGSLNDNWTGEVNVIATCTNTQNQTRESNEFKIIVVNVNDPPVFTSTPPTKAVAGEEYIYHVTADDGDNDVLTYNLTKKPENMTILPSIGRISWIPPRGGGYEVTIEVTDGQAKNIQNYIIVVPNRPPRIRNATIPEAYVGVRYVYDIPAVDDDGNELNFGLLSTIPGMTIDPATGRITWLPTQVGDFPVSVRISDKKDTTIHNFTVKVLMGNRIPQFESMSLVEAIIGIPYTYDLKASDEDGDALEFGIIEGPAGMVINASTGRISWTPNTSGNFTVRLKVSDGKGGEAIQEFVIKVSDAVRPQLALVSHKPGQTIKGTTTFSGSVTKGTREVSKVQLRIDGRDWTDAAGNYSWSYKLDTKTLKNGKHTFEFRAYDGKEYSDVVKAEFKVHNAAAAGKGFIPGLDGTLILIALGIGAILSLRSKRLSKKSV